MAISKGLIWKAAGVVLIIYSIIWGLIGDVPKLNILEESIRNLYFHVPMWFGMILLLLVSMIFSIRYLTSYKLGNDRIAIEFANTGFAFGILGFFFFFLWAKFTWGSYFSWDPKQLSTLIALLVYLAYFILRMSINDNRQRAVVSAVYNIFAFAALIPLLFILPRMTDSLHPGNGGNPGFNAYDLDNRMRMVFYPAVVGWTLIGAWVAQLRYRVRMIEDKRNYKRGLEEFIKDE